MPKAPARRQNPVAADVRLLDRASELRELQDALAAVRDGTGRVIVIEGPAGIGKTALLRFASQCARDTGIGVLSARASEFEQTYPWGIVRSLFAPALTLPETERAHIFSDAAALAEVPLALRRPTTPFAADGDALGAALHGLYWALANLALSKPLLVAVDDAQWADTPSLRWLEYLSARIEDLAVVLCVALNRADETADRELLLSLTEQATTLAPVPLSAAATERLVEQRLGPDIPARLRAACHADTAGNPFLVHAVLNELWNPAGEALAAQLADVHSAAIARALDRRLARLPPEARELAAALAVWGGRSPLPQAAGLAGIEDPEAAAPMADALAAAGVVRPGEPLEFVQPVIGAAVHGSIPPHKRSVWHARAAQLLDEAGAPLEAIASHLLAVNPHGDPLLVDVLSEAAGVALAAGAPETAEVYLERALAEPPTASQRPGVLRLLGQSEVSLHGPRAVEHLRAALAEASDVRERAQIARELAVPLLHSGHVHEAVAVLERSADELGDADRELSLELLADLVNAGRVHPELRGAALARARKLYDAGLPGTTFGERVALAAVAGEADAVVESADEAIVCAHRALARGQLLSEVGAESPSYWYAVSGLVLSDACETAETAVNAALADARKQGSKLGSALAYCFRSLLEYRTGRLREAESDSRYAIETAPSARWAARAYALAFLIDVLLDRGRPEEAATVLAASGIPETAPPLLPYLVLRQNRGRLRIRLGDIAAGMADMRAAAQGFASSSFGPCLWPWRSRHALELARHGEFAEARDLAREEAELADAFGAPRARGISWRTVGLIERGEAGIASLRRAVRVLANSPAVLEHARALIDLGALLRREGHRAEALTRLREGVDLAHGCAAAGLTETGRAEMVMAGARPRRDAGHGPDALTAGELRVARMAADGMTNREIAQALFVAVRTVETHLTHVYRKLQIESRDRLAAELG
jgi:ATP/maltotriose-dependent transcriptional regulator MalT